MFHQSKKSTSVAGPRKHCRTGYMKVGFMASMGDAVTAVAAAGREEATGRKAVSDIAEKEDYNKLYVQLRFLQSCRDVVDSRYSANSHGRPYCLQELAEKNDYYKKCVLLSSAVMS